MHESKSMSRFTEQIRQHIHYLPPQLRPRVLRESTQAIQLQVGRHKSWWKTTMAGGKGQGRSGSFRAALFSEAGLYARGSSAHKRTDEGLDEVLFGSVLSSLPRPGQDPLRQVVVESTADGPSGLFYKLVHAKMNGLESLIDDGSDWAFLFFPWFKFETYRMPVPSGFKPTTEERAMLDTFGPQGMTEGNLVWRRYKLDVERYTEGRFRKEYPATWIEPFLMTGGMWFDGDRLSKMQARVGLVTSEKDERVYLSKTEGHKFFAGLDTSGGTDRDGAVCVIVRDDGRVAAVWSSKVVSPQEQGRFAARLAARYDAPLLVEMGNRFSRAALNAARLAGARLWTTDEGGEFVMTRPNKVLVLDRMRGLLAADALELADPTLVAECFRIREQADGDIRADYGYTDDHVVAAALALWAARRAMGDKASGQKRPVDGNARVDALRKRGIL
jgi:hypothetical protein